MALVLTLAVLAALALGCPAPDDPVPCGPLRTWLVGLGVLTVSLLATAIALTTARRIVFEPRHRHRWLTEFTRWQKIHAMVWTVVAIVVLFWIDWPTVVRKNLQLEGQILLDELLILVPLLLPWALSWAAFYEVEAVLLPTFHTTPPCWFRHVKRRCRYVWEQARFSWTVALLPILWILTILDIVQFWQPDVAEGSGIFILCGLSLVTLAISFPWVLRTVWAAKPLPQGSLRDQLDRLTQRGGVRLTEILLWPTGGRIVNAAVTGAFARSRFVFLSDGLLERLRPCEVECVFAHELAHVRGRHVFWRVAWILLPMPIMGAICGPIFSNPAPGVMANSEFWLLTGASLTLAYVIFGFSWFCRNLEHAADLAAVKLLSQTESPVHAMKRYAGTLRKLDLAAAPWWSRWCRMHPSLEQRVTFLEARVAHE